MLTGWFDHVGLAGAAVEAFICRLLHLLLREEAVARRVQPPADSGDPSRAPITPQKPQIHKKTPSCPRRDDPEQGLLPHAEPKNHPKSRNLWGETPTPPLDAQREPKLPQHQNSAKPHGTQTPPPALGACGDRGGCSPPFPSPGAHRSQCRHWMSRSSSTYFSRQKGQTTRLAQGAQCV